MGSGEGASFIAGEGQRTKGHQGAETRSGRAPRDDAFLPLPDMELARTYNRCRIGRTPSEKVPLTIASASGRIASVTECAHAAAEPGTLQSEPVPVRAQAAVEQIGHGGGFAPSGILFLQRNAGNAAVARMVAGRAPPRSSGRALMRREIGEGAKGARPDAVAGDTGLGVKLLQRWLGVRETGVFDAATCAAVDQFQRQQGWEPSGVGPMTWAALENHMGEPGTRPGLNFGDRGPAVRFLQALLGVKQTSVFDTATRLVVDAFQRQQGWEPSGVGPMTWAALEKEAGLDAPSCVFPNCFGDRLGPVGGVVIGAIAGGLALRLAAPLIVGAWRWIRIAAGVSGATAAANQDKIAMEAEELETLVPRLMNSGGPQRVLMTFQSTAPEAGRDLS